MFSRSAKLLLAVHFAVALISLRLNDVQALSIPDVVASLANRRNLETKSVTFQDDGTITNEEEVQLKLLSRLLDKARNKKSVTFQGEDFDTGDDDEKRRDVSLKRFLETKLAPSLETLKRAIFLKHSYSGADRDTKQRKDNVQLKDRDYFQAIGIAPGGYESNPYSSNSWSRWGSSDDDY